MMLVRLKRFRVSCFLVCLTASAMGQDAFSDRPALPTGFSSSSPAVSIGGLSGSVLKGLDVTLGISTIYDSNVTLGSEAGAVSEEGDWLTTPSLKASYIWGAGEWQIGVGGDMKHLYYHDRDDFRNTNYGASIFGRYQSRRLNAAFRARFDSLGGINRFAGGFIDQNSFSTALSAGYRFSKKTSLRATFDSNDFETDADGFGDTSSRTFQLAGLWANSSRLTVGPGFRYGVRTGPDDEDFTLVGPSLLAKYELSSKVNFRSSIGFDWTDSPYSGDDVYANWSVALDYRASSLWGLRIETLRDTQAFIGSAGGFDLVSSYRFSYWRKIKSLTATLGISYDDRSPTDDLGAANGFRDGDFITLSANCSFPVYKDEADLIFSMDWSDQSSKDVNNSWDRFRTGLGLQWSF